MSKDEALQIVRIAAAHHTEMVELAAETSSSRMADVLLDAGDNLDIAIVLAHDEGASLFDLWRASRLPVGYVAALTSGSLES
jgi:hypothetical protein